MKAEEVFAALKRSSAYSTTEKERVKRKILTLFWNECTEELRARFDSCGMGSDGTIGFGHFVEALAARSPKVPKNTKSGERLSRLILGALHTCDDPLIAVRRGHNPDFIWIRSRGRRAEIIGFGEVKASFDAYLKNPEQIRFQENSIRRALESIERDKAQGTAHKFFARRKVVLREPLRKVLIVPVGVKEGVGTLLPDGWECLELEFSHEELTFIAQKIWPEFRPDMKFEEGLLKQYEDGFLRHFFAWGEGWLKRIFSDATAPIPYRELLIFACVTKRLPMLEKDIEFILPTLKKSMGLLHHHPQKIVEIGNLTNWQDKLRRKFVALFGEDENMSQQIRLFITNLRIISQNVRRWCESSEATRKRVGELDEVNILEF